MAATDALKYGDVFFDAVRLGIGLYGYGAEGVSPALTVFGRVIRTARLETGETVGYGGEYVASGGETVATVALGYADGLPRAYSGGYILIGGKRRKVIGRICMDMCFSEADESVKAGDTAVFLGRQGNEEITAEEIARKVGTIPYEILVGFKRIPLIR
ncbi:MAG TPA: hypothetical protein DDW54_01700 [Clostridiales bacterium]|nr:hypothetical protein [Clostridiales bacterium]